MLFNAPKYDIQYVENVTRTSFGVITLRKTEREQKRRPWGTVSESGALFSKKKAPKQFPYGKVPLPKGNRFPKTDIPYRVWFNPPPHTHTHTLYKRLAQGPVNQLHLALVTLV